MASLLRYFSDVMPVTYVVKAAQEIVGHSTVTDIFTVSIVVIFGFIVLALGLGAATLHAE